MNACLPERGASVGSSSSQEEACRWSRAPRAPHPSHHHRMRPPGRAGGRLRRQQTGNRWVRGVRAASLDGNIIQRLDPPVSLEGSGKHIREDY